MSSGLALFTPWARLMIEVFYGSTAGIAICGNILVIVVLALTTGFAPQMRLLLTNLAVSDLCMATLSIPFTYSDFIYLEWKFPAPFCYLAHFSTICCLFVTVYTLLLIALDR